MTITDIKNKIALLRTKGYSPGSSGRKGWLYHPIPFDEFKGMKVHKNNCVKEYQVINDNLKEDPKTILDIGSNVGYFSFSFNRQFGSNVIGVERDPLNVDITKALAEYYKISNVEFFALDVGEHLEKYKNNFNLTLMMNVHMWLVQKHGYEETKTIMKKLCERTKHLFFQTAHAESSGVRIIKELKNERDIVDYLIEAGFRDVQKVAVSKHGRKPRILFYARGKNEIKS